MILNLPHTLYRPVINHLKVLCSKAMLLNVQEKLSCYPGEVFTAFINNHNVFSVKPRRRLIFL